MNTTTVTAPREQSSRADCVSIASDPSALDCILEPNVLAVFVVGEQRPAWMAELEQTVLSRSFVQPRVILDGAEIAEIAGRVDLELGKSPLSAVTRSALAADLVGLVERCAQLTASSRFRFRFFTDSPNCRCSYHVDVVPPSTPVTALLKVYCGARTQYLEPSNLSSWEDFYSYVFRRERVMRELARAKEQRDAYAEAKAEETLDRLDRRLPFVKAPASQAATVPADAIVACKFVDSRHLWGATYVNTHAAHGWIHRSPMTGADRFVATVNAVS
jgi:hypothetical protein